MKSFILLIFSLMAGCEVLHAVKGCIKGWAEFTCYKTKTKENQKGKANNKGAKFLWYRDERNGHFMLFIEDLKQKDAEEYACKCDYGKLHAVKQKLQSDKCCLKPFHQTEYPSAKTTNACYVQKYDKSTGSKGSFRFTDTNSGFNVTISDVSLENAGVYWCELRSENRAHQSAQINLKLEVQKIRFFTRSWTIGQNSSYWCGYKSHTADKFICEGEDPSSCVRVASTAQYNSNNGKFLLSDDKEKKNITITMTDVAADDAGTYWCGEETSDPERSNVFFHRFNLTVEVPTISPVPSTQATTASAADSHGRVLVITTVIICVAVLLLNVLMLIYIYKRFLRSKTTRNGEPQPVREDYVYEEIQEPRRKPDTGNAMNSIYVTTNFPTNPSASLHYSTINFHKNGGETPKPSSSGCEYSTVKFTQSPKTVIQPSPSTDDALYSTVNKPQQQQQQRKIIPGRNI